MTTKTTSMRFRDEELALIDAIADVQHERTGIRPSRTDVIRLLLKRTKPSDDLGNIHARHRAAYHTVYGP